MQKSQLVSSLFNTTDYDLIFNEYGQFAINIVVKNMKIERTIQNKVAIKELEAIKTVFDQYNIRFFITHGTCLGAVRDKNFIPYDSDIDIGCYKTDIDKTIKAMKILRDRHAFTITKLSLDDESIAILKNNVIIDIVLYKHSGAYWQANKHKIFKIPYKFLAELEKIDFLGLKLNVPSNVEAYLEYQYGKEWRTPIQDFYSPYRKKIEVPIVHILKYFIGQKKATVLAKMISSFIKRIREKRA